MTDYQKTGRIDLAILDALASCAAAVNISVLHELVCASEEWVDLRSLSAELLNQIEAERVRRTAPTDSDLPLYAITCKGRAFLCAGDAKAIFGERIKKPFDWESSSENLKAIGEQLGKTAKPVQVTVCDREEPRIPSTALICLDEDELDDWWSSLDVNQKADAFTQFSLSQHEGHGCHVYVEPTHLSVPIVGTVGETAEEWKTTAERLKSSGEESIHIDPTSGVFSAETREYLRMRFNQRPKLRCSYCPSGDIPLKAQYSDSGEFLAATCRNPACEARFHAAFPSEPVVQQ